MFDKACSTKYFSDLYKTNKEMMDALCEEKINIAEVFYHAIQFELTLPGRLLTSNAKVLKDNVVIWKIDGFRLLAPEAESVQLVTTAAESASIYQAELTN